MKSKLYYWMLIVLACVGCKAEDVAEPDAPDVSFHISDTLLLLKNEEVTREITVQTNAENWNASVVSEDANWLSCFVQNGKERKLIVHASRNTGSESYREAAIRVTAGEHGCFIRVKQLGESPAILIGEKTYSLDGKSHQLEILVVTNVEMEIIPRADWIVYPQTKANREERVGLYVQKNETEQERHSVVVFRQKGGQLSDSVAIGQRVLGDYIPEGADDIRGNQKVKVSDGYATSEYNADNNISKSFDGNLNTTYHSAGNNTGPDYFPITLTYSFKDVPVIDYVVYQPQRNGYNGHFKEFEVWVSTEEHPGFTLQGTYDFRGVGYANAITFKGGLIRPLGVKFVVKSGSGGFAACAEMTFYRKTIQDFDPLQFFTDETCSGLKAGVTFGSIDTISNSFYRNLAFYLLSDKYPADFRVQTYKPYPHPDVKAAELKTSPYSLLDNPTGIAVTQGEEVVVFVGENNGENLAIQLIDFSKGYTGVSYPLVKGPNRFRAEKNGLLYIMYHTQNPAALPIKIHIASGRENGYFDKRRHDAGDWSRMLSGAADGHLDVLGEYAHLIFPVDRLNRLSGKQGKELIGIYDSIVSLEQELMGLKKYGRVPANRLLFHVTYGDGYMYAADYRTAYEVGTLDAGLCNPSRLRQLDVVWGPAHEVGHIHQTRPGFRWHGLAEVSNNLYSLYVQTSFGNKSYLEWENLGDGVLRYERAFTNTLAGQIPYLAEKDQFCKMIPYWQLQLYFAEVKGYKDFYPELFEQLRIRKDPETDAEAQLNFVKLCCEVSRTDLSDFFIVWGLLRPIDMDIDEYGVKRITITQAEVDRVVSEIKAMNLEVPRVKIEYLSDPVVETYRNNSSVVQGSATRSGNMFTMRDWQNVAVYEVWDKGRIIYICTRHQFKVDGASPDTEVFAVSAAGDKTKVLF